MKTFLALEFRTRYLKEVLVELDRCVFLQYSCDTKRSEVKLSKFKVKQGEAEYNKTLPARW